MIDPAVSNLIAKPFAVGAIAALGDRYWFQNNTMSNVSFGTAVAVGTISADLIGRYALKHESNIDKSIETRAMEIGGTAVLGLVADRFLFEKDRSYEVPQRVGLIVASDILGEYATNTFFNTTF